MTEEMARAKHAEWCKICVLLHDVKQHAIEHCLLCPTRIEPILKRCTVVKKNRHNLMEVLNDNDCTSFVPPDKLFDTPEEAWADYRSADNARST